MTVAWDEDDGHKTFPRRAVPRRSLVHLGPHRAAGSLMTSAWAEIDLIHFGSSSKAACPAAQCRPWVFGLHGSLGSTALRSQPDRRFREVGKVPRQVEYCLADQPHVV